MSIFPRYCSLGFDPDLTDDRLIRCVDGYRCDLKAGSLPGVNIDSDMQVISISPAEKCGAVDPLKSTRKSFEYNALLTFTSNFFGVNGIV